MAEELEGLADLTRKLRALGYKTAGNELRGSVRAAMKEVQEHANNTVPVGRIKDIHRTYKGRLVTAGFARRSLRVIAKVKAGGAGAEAVLGVRKEAFYVLQFIERGTAKYPAHPWLEPTFAASQSRALDKLASEIRRRIERIAKS